MVKFPEMAEHQNLQSDPCAPNISARVLSHITRLGLFGLIRTQFTGAVRRHHKKSTGNKMPVAQLS